MKHPRLDADPPGFAHEPTDREGEGMRASDDLRFSYIFATFDDHLACDGALQDLEALGVPADDLQTFTGAAGARPDDPLEAVEGDGFWARMAHALSGLDISAQDVERFVSTARRHGCVIACPLAPNIPLDRLTLSLQTQGSSFVRLYGPAGENRTFLPAD